MAGSKSKEVALKAKLVEFGKHYSSMVNSKEYLSPDEADRQREDRFRVSSFPYCGLKHLHKRLNGEEIEEEEEVTFGMKYYTSVGTQTHRYIQYVLGHGGQMLGKWVCLTNGCTGTDKIQHGNVCPQCKRPMDYEELTVRRGRHLTGHLDGVWRDKEGLYWLIDYKTSSVGAIRNNDKYKNMPYKKNVAQIVSYCALLERELDIVISGWILMYVARDNPMKVILPTGDFISAKSKRTIIQKIDKWAKHYEVVMTAQKLRDIQMVIEEKPCKTYDQYIASAYHSGFSPCPLGGSGICFKPKLLQATIEEDWKHKPKDWRTRRRPAYFLELEKELGLNKLR